MHRFFSSLVFLVFAIPHAFASAQEVPVIMVSGYATVEVAPDMATISLGAETQARQAVDAMRQNNLAMEGLFDVLKRAGVSAQDMQTSGLSLDPQYQHSSGNTPKLTGYVARNRVSVRIHNLDSLGGVLDAAISAGSNAFFGVNFGLQNPDAVQDAALAAAIARARVKAEIMATAAGVKLGKLVSISESGSFDRPVPMMREAMAVMDSVPVAAGSVGVSATANLVYEVVQ